MAASGERKGGGDPLPKEQKGGGDRSILSKLTGLGLGFSGGEVKTPTCTEDYNDHVRNEFGSDWLEVVEVSGQFPVSHRGSRDVQLHELLFRGSE